MNERQVAAWLSEARFTPFLVAADGDHARAVQIYQWHAELSAVTFMMIHGFEVLMRNAFDGVLGHAQPQMPLNATWLVDLALLQPNAIKQVLTVVERLGGRGDVTRSEVVARLPFGFWAALFGRRYDELWQTRLHRVLPHARESRDQLGARVGRIHRLRNRIAHHDCLLDQAVAGRVGDMLALAGWVDPAAPAWLRRAADVDGVLARRP